MGGFLQKIADSLTGKKNAVRQRQEQENRIRSEINSAKQQEIDEVNREFSKVVNELGIYRIESVIKQLENSKSRTKDITLAVIKTIFNDAADLIKILDNPNDHMYILSLLQFQPLHILVGLDVFQGENHQREIKQLLQYSFIDYESKIYNIVPVEEILKMGGEVQAAMRARLLQDIVKAIEQLHFVKALRLLDLDPNYLSNAIVPNSNGKTIIFYALSLSYSNNHENESKLNFVQTLIKKYNCDLSIKDEAGLTAESYAIQQIQNIKSVSEGCVEKFNAPDFMRYSGTHTDEINQLCHYSRANDFWYMIKEKFKEPSCILSEVEKYYFTSAPQMIPFPKIALMPFKDGIKLNFEAKEISANVINFSYDFLMEKVEFIGFVECKFAPGAFKLLCNYLKNCQHISRVILKQCNLTDEDAHHMTEVLLKLCDLELVDLSENKFSDQVVEKLDVCLRKIKSKNKDLQYWIATTSSTDTWFYTPYAQASVEELRKDQIAYVDKIIKHSSPLQNYRKKPDDIVNLGLSDTDLAWLDASTKDKQKILTTPKKVIEYLNDSVRRNIKKFRADAFKLYTQELKTEGVENWFGCTSVLPIIARILGVSIQLHENSFGNNIRVYEAYPKAHTIVILNEGKHYSPFIKDDKILVVNPKDDLNLFRACLLANLNYASSNGKPYHFSDRLAVKLRQATAMWMLQYEHLCKSSLHQAVDRLLDANTAAELYLATLDLPQSNLKITKELFTYKRLLDALPYIEKVFSKYGASYVKNDTIQMVNSVSRSVANMQANLTRPIDLGDFDSTDDLNLKKLSASELQEIFEQNCLTVCIQADKSLEEPLRVLNELEKAKKHIYEIKKEVIQKVIDKFNGILSQELHKAYQAYRAMRHKAHSALFKTVGITGLTFFASGFLGKAIDLMIASKSGLTTAARASLAFKAKFTADVALSTLSQQAINGGNLARLPEKLLKTALINGSASYVTGAIHQGQNTSNLPKDASGAKFVTVTQRTIESTMQAAVNHGNPLKNGLITAVAAGAVYGATGDTILTDSKFERAALNVGVRTANTVLQGGGSQAVLQAALLQAIETGASTVGEVAAASVVGGNKGSSKVQQIAISAQQKSALRNEKVEKTDDSTLAPELQKAKAKSKIVTAEPKVASAAVNDAYAKMPANKKSTSKHESTSNTFWPVEEVDPLKASLDEFIRRPESRYKTLDEVTAPKPYTPKQTEMRSRYPRWAAFFDALDPNLSRNANDSELMAELKMYGRSAKNVRDSVVYMITNPHIVVRDTFVFGADVIESGLHYYGGLEYNAAARERNYQRMDAAVKLWNADGLMQREAILTTTIGAMLFSRTSAAVTPEVVSSINSGRSASINLLATTEFRLPLFNPVGKLNAAGLNPRLKYLRTSRRNDLPLTKLQKAEIKSYAGKLGFPKDSIFFYEDMNISYARMFGQERLHIGLDVLPAPPGMGKTANSRVSMKGAVAHEIVGHRAAELAGKVNPNIILEEAQASIRAARYAPDLMPIERFTLLRDAMERLQRAGIKIRDVKHELWIDNGVTAPKLRD